MLTITFGLFAMWFFLAWVNAETKLDNNRQKREFLEKENKVLHDKIQEMYSKENIK